MMGAGLAFCQKRVGWCVTMTSDRGIGGRRGGFLSIRDYSEMQQAENEKPFAIADIASSH